MSTLSILQESVVQRCELGFIQFAHNLRVNFLDWLWLHGWARERIACLLLFKLSLLKMSWSSISVSVEDGTFLFSGPGTFVSEVFGQLKSMAETSIQVFFLGCSPTINRMAQICEQASPSPAMQLPVCWQHLASHFSYNPCQLEAFHSTFGNDWPSQEVNICYLKPSPQLLWQNHSK